MRSPRGLILGVLLLGATAAGANLLVSLAGTGIADLVREGGAAARYAGVELVQEDPDRAVETMVRNVLQATGLWEDISALGIEGDSRTDAKFRHDPGDSVGHGQRLGYAYLGSGWEGSVWSRLLSAFSRGDTTSIKAVGPPIRDSDSGPTRPEEPEAPKIRVSAIVSLGSERFVLVGTSLLGAGDTVPGSGGVIESIGGNSVVITTEAGSSKRIIIGTMPPAASGD